MFSALCSDRPVGPTRSRFILRIVTLAAVLAVVTPMLLSAFPRTVEDGLGVEIELEEPPQRIFSAGLAMDNIVLSLVDPARVVGVTTYAADPDWSYVDDKIGDHMVQIEQLDPELILGAEPDIVLVAVWSDQDAVEQLRDLGIKVYTFTAFDGVDDAMENITRIGEITGEDGAAEQLVADFHDSYERIAEAIDGRSRPAVLALNSWGTAAGSDTSFHDVIEMAGGRNLAADGGLQGWQEVNEEAIIAFDPEVIVTASEPEYAEEIRNDPVLQDVPAVREGRVYSIDHAEALNHHYIRAIESLAQILHPEAFGES